MTAIIEIKVPDIGGAENVEVIEVLVQVGHRIELDQGLITVETDKATMEIPSPRAGVIKELKVSEGSTVSEGVLIALLEQAEAPAEEPQAAKSEPSQTNGVTPTSHPKSLEQKALPATQEPSANNKPSASKQPSSAKVDGSSPMSPQALGHGRPAYASPSVRQFARELEVPLENAQATGDKGRITREDIVNYVRKAVKGELTASSGGAAFADLLPWPEVDFEQYGPIERQSMSRIRKVSSANLHRNWVRIPHVTNHEDADISELEEFRVQLNREHEKSGTKVTLLALLIKACVAALKKFPDFNASLDGEEIILKGYYHIGFAADTPNGLLVPVIKDADRKGILEIADEVTTLAAKAREGKLTLTEMSGGCFSISSLGGIGGRYFTPIINAPEVAILGVSKARTEVVWNGRSAEPRLILPLSLSWDHRVVDGAMAGRFNAYLANVLADFRRILL